MNHAFPQNYSGEYPPWAANKTIVKNHKSMILSWTKYGTETQFGEFAFKLNSI